MTKSKTKNQCSICLEPKATLQCKLCAAPLCKRCPQYFEEEQMAYLDGKVPRELKGGGVFCNSCFEQTVAPELAKYDEIMARAKEVFVFYKEEGKETRLIKRSLMSFTVHGEDHNDIVLKLAFMAAKSGFNAVVDILVTSDKRREGSFKILTWSGTGTAAQVDAAKHNR